jgi:hypothetical protein
MRHPAFLSLIASPAPLPLRLHRRNVREIFISVDMEGIGGIGTPAMTSPPARTTR